MTHREAAIHHLEQGLAHPESDNLKFHCQRALAELRGIRTEVEDHRPASCRAKARALYDDIMHRPSAGTHTCDCKFAEVIRLIVGGKE